MQLKTLSAELSALPNKRAFVRKHKLPARTLWRIIAGGANPTASTANAFVQALKAERRAMRKASQAEKASA